MKLYDYFRSTASYRVRIAMNLKGINYEKIGVHLVNNGGEQHSPEYRKINPQGLVPCLEVEGEPINQSLAIIEYLNDIQPTPALLPQDPFGKATVRSLALMIVCDMHPLNNLRVLKQLKMEFHANETQVTQWYHHWLKKGFDALEAKLQTLDRTQPFCVGDSPSMADLCLIPQVFNAKRFNFALDDYPLIREIDVHCLTLKAFQDATPQEA
ncbi:maleylacetoacetate isomerase [Legionella lytica]|uniref:Maleylacetoacetate isomerase n=1 Tax=Legionella lytica TaxID=96232 RepID=A0ABW8DAQ9_9GAMM